MNKRRALVVAAVLAALVLAYKLYDCSRDKSAGAGDGEDGVATSDEKRVERARARKAELLRAKPATLAGVVLDAESKAPVAGAVVSFGRTSLDFGASLNPGEARAPIMVVTGPDGRFRLDRLPSGELSVTATAAGYLPTSRDPIITGPGEEKTNIELLLVRGGFELSGQVTDVGGGAIAGAYVRAQRFSGATVSILFRAPITAMSGPDGRYAMTLEEGAYFLTAGHADYIADQRDTEIIGGSRTEDFSLVPGATISGRVLVADSDEPVANALVTPTPGGGRISGVVFQQGARTDAEGRFVLSGLKSGEVKLIAVARSYASREPTAVYLAIAEQRTDVTIYVDAAYTISGFVVDKEQPTVAISRVMVAAYNIGTRSAAVTSDPSLSDGYFEIVGVVPGSYTLGAIGERLLPEIASQSVEVVDKDIDGLVVKLSRGLSIRGRVVPPVAAYVRLEVDAESFSLTGIPRMIASQLARTTAGEDGRFELSGLTTGKVTVVAEHSEKGIGRLPVDVQSPGLVDVVVELAETGSIAGTVTDARGKPVARARVRAAGEKGQTFGFGSTLGDWNSAISRDDGSFVIRGLGSGAYKMEVRRDSQRLLWAGPSIAAAGGSADRPIDVELAEQENKTGMSLVVEAMTESIRGRVLSTNGEAVPDAWVRLGPNDDQRFRGGFGDQRRRQNEGSDEAIESDEALFTRISPKLTDAEGAFIFEGLRAGEYWVSAEGPAGDSQATVRPVATGANVTVRLESIGSASGAVTLSGAPVKNFTLKIDGPRLVRQTFANDGGSYSVERLPSGRYEFQVQSGDGRARQAVVLAGKPIVVNFELEPYSEVTGQVLGVESKKPMAGYAVFALSEGADTDAVGEQIVTGDVPRTDAEGRFVISRQGVGNATILILEASGGFTPVAQKKVALEVGERVDAGILYGIEGPPVAADLRGELGLSAEVMTFAARPNKDDGATMPAGAAATDEFLWITAVAEGGAAAAAGLALGDRITKVDAIDLAETGPHIGQHLLTPQRNGVGTTRTLTLAREGLVIAITARSP